MGQKHCPADDDGSADGTGESTATETTTMGESGEGSGGTCDLFQLMLEPQTPTIQLLVDQSLSMDQPFDMTTRWEAIKTTLIDPQDGVVTTLQGDVRFGISLYTSDQDAMVCPALTETPPDLNNLANVQMLLDNNDPLGQTPTGESLSAVATAFAMEQAPGEKYIVLATDGEPDTCAQPDPNEGQPDAVAAAQAAFGLGIEVFVISVGDQISDQHLQDMANAGAGVQAGDPDATFYKALDQQALLDAFNEIIQGVRDCRIDLQDAIFPDKADLCTVIVNGMEVPLDDPNGWQVNDSTEIELVGQTCTSIQEGEVTIEMECDCAALQ